MAVESHRRVLLAESDYLLDDVETLRLHDETEAPLRLREAIRALQIRLGRRNPPLPPATLDAAHELVFAVQQRLMAANPANPRPVRHANRPSGQPVFTIVREDRRWKVLTLPPPLASGDDAAWPQLALAVADAAWSNYWLLLQDAERIMER